MLLKAASFALALSADVSQRHNHPPNHPPLPPGQGVPGVFTGTNFTLTELPEPYKRNKELKKFFSHYTSVFGIPIFGNHFYDAHNETWKINHVANILAQWIDNDQDGQPDNPLILQSLQGKLKIKDGHDQYYAKGALVMFRCDNDKCPEFQQFLDHTPEMNVYWKDVNSIDITVSQIP